MTTGYAYYIDMTSYSGDPNGFMTYGQFSQASVGYYVGYSL
jgi:hypothetical protein